MGVGCSCLDQNQYVILDHPTGREIRHGPGCIPFCCASSDRHEGITLTQTQYLRVEHLGSHEGQEVVEIISGPQFYMPEDPYARISNILNKVQLTKNQYCCVVDARTGARTIVEGPTMYTPGPYDNCSEVANKPNLSDIEYIIVTNQEDGSKKTVCGPRLYTPGPFESCSKVMKQIVLNRTQYCYVTHLDKGDIIILTGPQTFAPRPNDQVSDITEKIVLKKFEYIKIVDHNTGIIRVERGPSNIMLQPYEKTIGHKTNAYEINDVTAVHVVNNDTGNHELVCMRSQDEICDPSDTRPIGPFLYFPSATQEVVEVQQKIRLQQHECMVIVDKFGKYSFRRGSDETRNFFVPPYCNILEQEWSVDLQKYGTKVSKVSRFDLRPQYMDFQFEIRTKDNVEIVIDLNFYWQILNIEKMVAVTSDVHEDICKHAMSQILAESSRRDMKEFMESFNEIIQEGMSKDDGFYAQRGVIIHKVEITGRRCKDQETEKIFHEIIKQKTHRIKNLEKQHGDNEVLKSQLENEIEAEKLKGLKSKIHNDFVRSNATADGQSEADRIAHFLDNLPADLSKEDKLRIYFDQQNTSRVKAVAEKTSQLIVNPKDMDITFINHEYRGGEPVGNNGNNGSIRSVPEIVPIKSGASKAQN